VQRKDRVRIVAMRTEGGSEGGGEGA